MSKPESDRLRVLLIIAAVALVGLVIVRIVISHRTPEEKLADQWLEAVRKGDAKTAIEIANKLVPSGHDKIVLPAYKDLFIHEKLPVKFLTDSFNFHDFRAWYEAVFFHELASGKTVKQVFDLVRRQIKPVEKEAVNEWPGDIWKRRFGLCDRMSWVLSELAYQQGNDTCIVYLKDKVHRKSPHTVVEIRSGQQVWLADPLKGMLAQGRAVERIANDPSAVKQVWPKNEYWQECLKHSMLYTPSMPSDYCSRNQQLQKVLKELLWEKCPRFGEDPQQRQVRVTELRKIELGNGIRFPMTVWNHPLRLLYRDIFLDAEVKPAIAKKESPKVEVEKPKAKKSN